MIDEFLRKVDLDLAILHWTPEYTPKVHLLPVIVHASAHAAKSFVAPLAFCVGIHQTLFIMRTYIHHRTYRVTIWTFRRRICIMTFLLHVFNQLFCKINPVITLYATENSPEMHHPHMLISPRFIGLGSRLLECFVTIWTFKRLKHTLFVVQLQFQDGKIFIAFGTFDNCILLLFLCFNMINQALCQVGCEIAQRAIKDAPKVLPLLVTNEFIMISVVKYFFAPRTHRNFSCHALMVMFFQLFCREPIFALRAFNFVLLILNVS